MQDNQKTVLKPVAAGFAGIAAGAALGVSLSNKNTRKKITNTIKNIQAQGMEKLNVLKKAAHKFTEQTQHGVEKAKRSAQKSIKTATM